MTPEETKLLGAAERAMTAAREVANATGPELIDYAKWATYGMTQADLARVSGLTPNTITALNKGKRPTAAQRSAILWAIFKLRT